MYYPRIDALRCYAVIAVLFSHFFGFAITRHLYTGIAGVDLFFVISGFLITEILLKYKVSGKPISTNLKKFYLRRSLRIFPIYYLYLGITAIFFWSIAYKVLPYAFGYIINFYQQHHDVPPFYEHLWSLSVEEQFYLFWPLLILTVPHKYLVHLIVSVIFFAVASRLFITGINHKLLTTSCLDAFGLGALFAYLKNYNDALLKKILKLHLPWILGIACYISIVILSFYNAGFLDQLFRLAISVISFYLIGLCIYPSQKQNTLTSRFLENEKAIFIGKISYGIYIYHLLIGYLADPFVNVSLFRLFGQKNNFLKYIYFNSYVIKFPLYTLITIGVAALSFRFIEKPITAYKNRVLA